MFYTRERLEALGALDAPHLEHLSVDPDADRSGVTWHWTGFDGALYKPDPLERLRGIQQAHFARGYGDIAYNGAFDVDGNIYALRDAHWTGAHAASTGNVANVSTLGFVFLEDVRGLTAGAVGPMQVMTYLFELRYKHPPAYFGHRDWVAHGGTPTQCPGDELEAFVAWLRGLGRR